MKERGVVIVAPPDAAWPKRAEPMFAGARMHVARIEELHAATLLLVSGEVSALVVDYRCKGADWAARVSRLRALSPPTRIIVVGVAEVELATVAIVAWPDDPDEALALVEIS
jgi:hypothetical protein